MAPQVSLFDVIYMSELRICTLLEYKNLRAFKNVFLKIIPTLVILEGESCIKNNDTTI